MQAVGKVAFKYPDEQIRDMVEAKRVEQVSEEINRLFQFSVSIGVSRKNTTNEVLGLKSNWAHQEIRYTESYVPVPDTSNSADKIPTFKNDKNLSNSIADAIQALYVKKFSLIRSDLLDENTVISLNVTLLYVDQVWEELTPIELTIPITRQLFFFKSHL